MMEERPNEAESKPWLRLLTASDEEIQLGDIGLPKFTFQEATRALLTLARAGWSFKDFIQNVGSGSEASK
jgi:hypothetical protein